MDISKFFAIIGSFLLIVCLTLSITTLVVLRNAIDENEQMQGNAAQLIDQLNASVNRFDTTVNADVTDSEDTLEDLPTNAKTEQFWVREYNGKIAVYNTEGNMIHWADTNVSLLPAKDREALAAGIEVESMERLIALLEDYTS